MSGPDVSLSMPPQAILLHSTESPLVLNGLRKESRFHEHDGSPYSVDESDPTRSQGHELALILSARIERSEGINEQLSTVMNVVIDPDDVEDRIELKPLTREETRGKLLIAILKALNVDFAPSLTTREVAVMRNVFWNETLGDWHAIAKRQRRLKDLVGPNRGQRRFLTRDVFEAGMGKPLPPLSDDPPQQHTSSP